MAAAGLLNRQIEVYKPITLTNAVGATSTNWTKVFETRANVRNIGMNRGQQINEIFYPTTKEFIIRSYHHLILSNKISKQHVSHYLNRQTKRDERYRDCCRFIE